MENVSKAVIIGGTMIITILVMAVLWNLYTNFQIISKTDDNTKKFEQDIEYNKKFQAYNRKNIKGIDILSLYNLVEDYNLREAKNSDISEINVTIYITKGNSYYVAKKYSIKEIKKINDSIEKEILKLLEKKYNNKTIQYLSELTKEELNKIKQQYEEDIAQEIENEINKFNEYKKVQDTFKQKEFNLKNIEYKDQRITKMEFTD